MIFFRVGLIHFIFHKAHLIWSNKNITPVMDLSSRTNLRVELENNFRRAAFGLQENSKIDHVEDRCNHKVRRTCEIHY